MPTSLSDARTALRERLDEATAAQWTNTELDRWLEEGAREVAFRAQWKRSDPTAVPFTAGDQTENAPSDLMLIESAAWQTTGSTWIEPLHIREWNEMTPIWGSTRTQDRSTPAYLVARGTIGAYKLHVWPVPSAAGNVILTYIQTALPSASNSNNLDIPEGWIQAVLDWAEYKAFRRDRDDRWQSAQQQFFDTIGNLMDATRTYHTGPAYVSEAYDTMMARAYHLGFY